MTTGTTVSTSAPELGRAVTEREHDALERALAERSRQVFVLLRETSRLPRQVDGWERLDDSPEGASAPDGLRVRRLHSGAHAGRAGAFNQGVRNAAAEVVVLLADAQPALVLSPLVQSSWLPARQDRNPALAGLLGVGAVRVGRGGAVHHVSRNTCKEAATVSPIIDVHTHYLAIARFPEIAGIEGLVPDATESGALRTTIEGVSSII